MLFRLLTLPPWSLCTMNSARTQSIESFRSRSQSVSRSTVIPDRAQSLRSHSANSMLHPTFDIPGTPMRSGGGEYGGRIKSAEVGFDIFPGESGIAERSTEEEQASQSSGSALSAKVT